MKKRYLITIVLLCILVGLFLYGQYHAGLRGKLVYCESLDKIAVTVDGVDLTLRDMAFYVAFEENLVEKQAMDYEPEDTSKYWNVQVGGMYVRVAARNTAIQMAVHDEIFYKMAMEDGLGLSEEEEESLAKAYEEFWCDLSEDEKLDRLGVTEEELYEGMHKMILAQKFQYIYAEMEEKAYEDYDFNGKCYDNLLKQHKYKIHKDVWRRVNFGNITLDHNKK